MDWLVIYTLPQSDDILLLTTRCLLNLSHQLLSQAWLISDD